MNEMPANQHSRGSLKIYPQGHVLISLQYYAARRVWKGGQARKIITNPYGPSHFLQEIPSSRDCPVSFLNPLKWIIGKLNSQQGLLPLNRHFFYVAHLSSLTHCRSFATYPLVPQGRFPPPIPVIMVRHHFAQRTPFLPCATSQGGYTVWNY